MVERIRTLLETRQLTPTQFADAIGVARPIVSHILSGRNKPSLEVVQRILAAMPELSMPWLLNGTGAMLAATAAPAVAPPPAVAPAPMPTTAPSAPAPAPTAPVAAQAPIATVGVEYAKTRAAELFKHGLGYSNHPQAAELSAPAAPAAMPQPLAARTTPVARPAIRRFVAVPSKLDAAADSIEGAPAAPEPAPEAITASPAAAIPPAPAPIITPVAAAPAPPEPEATPATPPVLPPAEDSPAASAVANSTAAALFAGAEKPIRRIVIFYRDGSFADYQPE